MRETHAADRRDVEFSACRPIAVPVPAELLSPMPADVVGVGANETVRLLGEFSRPSGLHGRYLIHCHNLFHEDHDMTIHFQAGTPVALPGAVDEAPPPHEAGREL